MYLCVWLCVCVCALCVCMCVHVTSTGVIVTYRASSKTEEIIGGTMGAFLGVIVAGLFCAVYGKKIKRWVRRMTSNEDEDNVPEGVRYHVPVDDEGEAGELLPL